MGTRVRRGTIRRRRLLWLIMLPGATACLPTRHRAAPAPSVEARDLAVYRTVAESLYVRSTQGLPVAIVTTPLDTSCVAASAPCAPLEARWGLDSAWREESDRGTALATSRSLLARAGSAIDLSAVALGHLRLIAVPADSVPLGERELEPWRLFREANDGAAGVLRFSPVGFDPGGQRALVFVHWECGPSCGHELAAALRQESGVWLVEDVLLMGARRPSATSGTAP